MINVIELGIFATRKFEVSFLNYCLLEAGETGG